jgi:hypothetical protein
MSVTFAADEALIARLQADATLATLAPGGVWPDVSPENTTDVHVVVALQIERTADEQGGAGYRAARLQVKAVGRSTDAEDVKAAADRIAALLDGQSFSITGETLMTCHRAPDNSKFAYTERDGPYLWKHAGFDFELWSDPS